MTIRPIRTRIFRGGEDLAAFITAHVRSITTGSILAVTSKIVALSEGRTVIVKNKKEKGIVIRSESTWAKRTKYVWLTEKDGMILANAGVDESNASGKLILLPKNSFKTASLLRKKLSAHYKIKKLGIVITDSRIMPLRAGVVGIALGYAGFQGLRDYRGKPDLFGRSLKFTQTDVADSLASVAAFAMGEGAERQPLCIIEGAPVEFAEHVNRKELMINLQDDMYRPLITPSKGKR